MAASTVGEFWWVGVLMGIAGILFPFVVNWRKGKIDESTMVLSKWKELVESHEKRISSLNEEINSLRDRLIKAEDKIAAQAAEILALREENAGLKRAIAQNSESSAIILGNHISSELVSKSERARKGKREDEE